MKSYTGINIQWPISEDITAKRKSIETRTYPIPTKMIGEELLLIETPGKTGRFKARATAIIKFKSCKKYKSKKEFYLESRFHLVTRNSPWAWKDKEKYGWEVEVIKVLTSPIEIKKRKGIVFTKDITFG